MIYLGNKPIGILAILPEWAKNDDIELEFNQYQSFNTANDFFNDTYVQSIISLLSNGNYKIVFENNTTNTRAGEWITFTKDNSVSSSSIKIKRIGMTNPASSSYGVDVYDGAKGVIYRSTKEVTLNG